ncbi:30S ribosomal protein S2 [Candidatus Saccharibacteria bacterium]|nr:30S ribosomal protein S2 [Candidatus Saccharibacteria bacterium]
MLKPDMKALFETGAHFGHKTSRWNPKMAKFIHSKRGENHIIDLAKTVDGIEKAQEFLSTVAASNRQILFVGTKKQAKAAVKSVAETLGQPYVTERWLGGMLTNYNTIGTQIKRLKQLEKRMETGELANRYSKLEVQRFQEQIDLDNIKYGGIKDMKGRPGAVIVTDVVADKNAVAEAIKLHVPVVGLADTNANPDGVDYIIPANDDAIKSLELILDYLASAVKEGATKVEKEEK